LLLPVCSGFQDFRLDCCDDWGGPGVRLKWCLYIYSTMRYLDGYGAALVVVTFLLLIAAVAIASFLLNLSCQNGDPQS